MFEGIEDRVVAGEAASLAWQNEDARQHFQAVVEAFENAAQADLEDLLFRALKGLAELDLRSGDHYGAGVWLTRARDLGAVAEEDPYLDLLAAHVLRLQGEVSGAVRHFDAVLKKTDADVILKARATGGLAELHGRDDWWLGGENAVERTDESFVFQDDFERGFGAGWQGHELDLEAPTRNGVTIFSKEGRGLGLGASQNELAPRILRSIKLDFSMQVLSLPNHDHRPSLGGLVIWQNSNRFLCLIRGQFGPNDVTVYGCEDSVPFVWGQVRICGEMLYLKIAREGEHFIAYCGRDGEKWICVGRGDLGLADEVKVGMFASGDMDRLVYPGTHRAGTAMKFTQFKIWGDGQTGQEIETDSELV